MKSFLKKYIHKFQYAFAGLFDGIAKDASIRLQVVLGLGVIVVRLFLPLNVIEWSILLLLIGIIIALEFINSSLETIVDMVSPHYSEGAKKAKDYAAAAVLVMSMIAALIGLGIIGGKIIWILQ